MDKKERALEAQIRKIKEELAALGDLRPGSLSQQYNVCGNPHCRCKDDPPRKHGPYSKLTLTRKAKAKCTYVRSKDVAIVKRQLRNYARMRALVDRWVGLSEELCIRRLRSRGTRVPEG